MTIDEMIAVLQAAKAGKQIECSVKGENNWFHSTLNWNFASCEYRVKPEPREWTVYTCADGNIYSGSTSCRANPIKVREVL